ncbi:MULTISPECIES: major capsid protein [Clostridium]|uniref:major capsid protein n=1 Tax=Clostridium TaxID=1485 RepID=UPI000825934D|nr:MULTISPECIES: major capsid protein [Clostridium]PJI07048.1 phage capsid protein [Clostridium sp. CT7]
MNLQDFINANQISLYIEKLPIQSTIDKTLFPPKKQLGTEIELAKGSMKKPVALKMSAFDTAVKSRALSASLNIEKKEMPFFKESVLIKEKERQFLLLAIQSNNQNLVEQLTSQIYDNYKSLVDGAEVQMIRMRAQALQTGKINISTDDGDIVVDYNVPSQHKETLTGTATWDNEDADIVGDLIRWSKVLTNNGYGTPTRILLTDTVLGYIKKNKAINGELVARNPNLLTIITDNDIINYLNGKLDLSVGILNGNYIDESGAIQNYYQDDLVTLIPEGALGSTVYGTTPEEADRLYGTGKLDTSIVNTGVAITTMLKEDPVTVETKVSELGIPSFDRVDECFFATVK